MEEVNQTDVLNESDAQFRARLDKAIGYNNRDDASNTTTSTLIKELNSRGPKQDNQPTKPIASLNSSTYSSAASSHSSSDSSSSSSSSSSSASSTSSSSSSSSSTTSSASSESSSSLITSSATSSASSSPSQSQIKTNAAQFDKLEMAKMEDLGKTAKILEHTLSHPLLSATALAIDTATSRTSAIRDINNSLEESTKANNPNLSQTTAQKFTPVSLIMPSNPYSIPANPTVSANSWKTISAKRDKRRKKPVEKAIQGKDIPGNMGYKSVDELTAFINSNSNKSTNKAPQQTMHQPSPRTAPQQQSQPQQQQQQQQLQQHQQQHHQQQTNHHNNQQQQQSQHQPKQPQQNQNQKQKPKQKQPLQQQQQQSQPSPQPQQSTTQQRMPQQQTQNKPVTKFQPHQQQRKPQKLVDQSQLPSPKLQQEEELSKQPQSITPKSHIDSQVSDAVTFADHLKVCNEKNDRYTFGFFDDEQTFSAQSTTKPIISKHDSPAKNTRKQAIQSEQKQKSKQSKASPNSEEGCNRVKDNVKAKNFNYEQILRFISNAWENAQVAASRN